MPVVDHVDYAARRIYLSIETVDAELDTLDVYREVRALRRATDEHRKYRPLIEAGGNIEKIKGVSYTPAYVRLLHGCRIVPYNLTQKMRLVRDTFTDDGLAGRDCFDRTPLSLSVTVDIDVDFPEIEIRCVAVSGSDYTPAEIAAAVLSAAQITPIHSNTKLIDDEQPSSGSGATPTQIAEAVRTELSPELSNLDAKVSKTLTTTKFLGLQ